MGQNKAMKAESNTKSDSIYRRYWSAYGGLKAIIQSGYFWSAVVITLVCNRLWLSVGWWDSVLSILPNLLGFSLGGFALWLAIGDDSFRKEITKRVNGEKYTIYASINASFVHFIVLQVAALVCALVAKSLNFELPSDSWILENYFKEFFILCDIGAFIGFLLFVYALLTALASTLGLFQITFMYEHHQNMPKKPPEKTDNTTHPQ